MCAFAMKKAVKLMILASVVAFAVPLEVRADKSERGQRGDRARTFLVLRIAEELDLSDEKALKISGILEKASEQRRALRAERDAMAPQLESAVGAADEAAITDLVTKAREIDRKILLVVADSFAEVDGVLTVVERGKLALLLPQIHEQLRHGGRRGGWRGGDREERRERQRAE